MMYEVVVLGGSLQECLLQVILQKMMLFSLQGSFPRSAFVFGGSFCLRGTFFQGSFFEEAAFFFS
jgi:hypothetical protein